MTITHARLSELYDEFAPKIYRYLLYRTQHTETAEDLTAQTFLKAVHQIKSYQEEKGAFSAWIYRIARNTLIDHYRAKSSAATTPIEDVWDLIRDSKDMAHDTDVRQKLEEVQAAIANLPSAQREVILLRVWDGYSFAEIAEMTGKTEAACKMSVSRGLATLRSQLSLGALCLFFLHTLTHI